MISSPYERAKQSIFEEFEKFRSKIEPTENEKRSISASHTKMRTMLENSTDVKTVDTFLTGSYARDTMIRPLKDVDFIVQVHYGQHQNDTPMQLFNKISRILRSAYPLTPISITPPCITIKLSYCHLEVVPAIGFSDNEELFKIPTVNGLGWQQTYPKIPAKWMTQENKQAGGLFKPTVKMLKRWRDVHKIPLKSFHLEMLIRMAFSAYKIEDYADGVWAFFARTSSLLDLNKTQPFIPEPGTNNGYVDQYLYANPVLLALVRYRIKTHFTYAQKAFDDMKKGQIGYAKYGWGKILGSGFYTPAILPPPPPPLFSPPSLLPPPVSTPSNTTLSAFLTELLKGKNNGEKS